METKTQKAIDLWNEGRIKESLRIFKTFRRNVSSSMKRSIEITYECLTGKREFYESLDIDTEALKNEAFNYLKETYKLN